MALRAKIVLKIMPNDFKIHQRDANRGFKLNLQFALHTFSLLIILLSTPYSLAITELVAMLRMSSCTSLEMQYTIVLMEHSLFSHKSHTKGPQRSHRQARRERHEHTTVYIAEVL